MISIDFRSLFDIFPTSIFIDWLGLVHKLSKYTNWLLQATQRKENKQFEFCLKQGQGSNRPNPTSISFPEPTCLLVSTKTRSSGIINKLVPRAFVLFAFKIWYRCPFKAKFRLYYFFQCVLNAFEERIHLISRRHINEATHAPWSGKSKNLDLWKLIIPELRVLVLTKRHVGSGNEIDPTFAPSHRHSGKMTAHASSRLRDFRARRNGRHRNKPRQNGGKLRWMVPVFRFFWICKLWKKRTKNQLNIITKFVYDSIAKFVLVQKRQLFCHQLLPWQRYLMIVQTYFWASNAYILKTNLVTPNFFHICFFVIWKWNYMII